MKTERVLTRRFSFKGEHIVIFHGTRYGVNLFNGRVQWFTDRGEAEALEKIEVAKFAARDSERERIRLARLGLKEVARTYSVSLPEPTTAPRSRRGRNLQ